MRHRMIGAVIKNQRPGSALDFALQEERAHHRGHKAASTGRPLHLENSRASASLRAGRIGFRVIPTDDVFNTLSANAKATVTKHLQLRTGESLAAKFAGGDGGNAPRGCRF